MSINFKKLDYKIEKIICENNLTISYDGNYSSLDEKECGFDLFYSVYETTPDEFAEAVYLIGREIAKAYEFIRVEIEMDLYPFDDTDELKGSLVIKQH